MNKNGAWEVSKANRSNSRTRATRHTIATQGQMVLPNPKLEIQNLEPFFPSLTGRNWNYPVTFTGFYRII